MTSKKTRKKASKICDILIEHYGDTIHPKQLHPIDELVLTILSQNTTDVNSQRAFEKLKKLFPTWEQVLDAPQESIADAIRSSGVFNIKAQRIKATLTEIKQRVGKLDLSLLKDMELEKAKQWLTSLHGVGPKTAAIVLLFSFGRPALPVDTHVWRVTKRVGLIPQGTSREKAHILLEKTVPETCIYSLNYNLVRHGRKVCKAQKPHCNECILTKSCDYFKNRN
jgi:endonuclease-3